jgi:hypothetical protein
MHDTKNIIEDVKMGFPDGADKSQIKLTTESLYSVTPHNEANIINKHIISAVKYYLRNNPNSLTIVDGSANVGGNTIPFATIFKNVVAVEIDKLTCEYLQHNVSLYSYNNIKCINGDIGELIASRDNVIMGAQVLFLDPPWGGVLYKFYPKVELLLGKRKLVEVIGDAFKCDFNIIAIKVPFNYIINDLYPFANKIQVFKISNYKLVIISK